jgi:ABC-type transporter Mla subunit MlaD
VQETVGGTQGAVLTPGLFDLDPTPQNTVQRVLFGANTPQRGGTNIQRIQQIIANAWAGAMGNQGGANAMMGGANTMMGGANLMMGGANTMAADENDFMQGMTGTDDNVAARGNNAINLLGGLTGAQQGLGGAINIATPVGATVKAALQRAIKRSNENGQRFNRELCRQEQLGEAKKEDSSKRRC